MSSLLPLGLADVQASTPPPKARLQDATLAVASLVLLLLYVVPPLLGSILDDGRPLGITPDELRVVGAVLVGAGVFFVGYIAHRSRRKESPHEPIDLTMSRLLDIPCDVVYESHRESLLLPPCDNLKCIVVDRALEFLRSGVLEGEEHKERFLREAQAAAALDHSNICTVYEIDDADGQTFLSIEGLPASKDVTMTSHHRRALRIGTPLAGALLFLTYAMTATAQDRMPPIPEGEMTDEQKAAVEEFKAARNTTRFGGPFVPLLRSPEMMSRARNVGDYVRFNSVLPPRLSEFVILITARHWTQNYEWAAHAPIAEREGLKSAIIEAIADGRRPEGMADDESVVYDFCMELLRTHGVSDPTYARLVSQFDEKGVIDTIGIMGYYQLLAMVMNTARTALRDGIEPGLRPFPR